MKPCPWEATGVKYSLIKGSILFSTDNKHQHYWSRHQLTDLYIQKNVRKLNMLLLSVLVDFQQFF